VLLVYLHGAGSSGDELRDFLRFAPLETLDGRTFRDALAELNVELLCPSAAWRKYTLAGGQMARTWFDRRELSPSGPEVSSSTLVCFLQQLR
jgi:hypothetical protein